VLLAGGAVLGGGVALAANDHTVPPPDVFSDVNPCNGNTVTITQTYKNSVIHFSEDANGGGHFTGTMNGTITTDDGYSGRFTVWFGENASADGSHDVNGFTFSATLGNGSGQHVVVHETGHLTVVGGDIVVSFDKPSAECTGKPA
jgi:hypothetical protein